MAKSGKSSQSIRLEDLKSVIQKLYFEKGAAEQIENILNGRNDRKGPLSKAEKKMFGENEWFPAFMKKLCIEKALTDVAIETWNDLTDGLNVEDTSAGEVTKRIKNNTEARNKRLQFFLGNDRTVNDFVTHIKGDSDKGMEFYTGLRGKIDRFMEIQESTPNLSAQREKCMKTIDRPIIDIIEQSNGSDEHMKQAATFVLYATGNKNIGVSQGQYTYKDLARIAVLTSGRQAFKEMYQYQSDKNKFNDRFEINTKYFDKDEMKTAVAIRKKMSRDMAEAMSSYKQNIGLGNPLSLNDYKNRITELHERENDIRLQYNKEILDISINKTKSEMKAEVKSREAANIRAEEISGDFYSAYNKAFQQLDGYVANARDQYRELVNSGAMDRMIEEEEDGR